jgi:hypothetical protein
MADALPTFPQSLDETSNPDHETPKETTAGGIPALPRSVRLPTDFPSLCTNKIEVSFYAEKFEALVGKVVCHDKMHIFAKLGS